MPSFSASRLASRFSASRRKLLLAPAALLLALLAGCASVTEAPVATAEPQAAPQDQRLARLYFLRQSGLVGSIAADARVLVDGQAAGVLEAGSYFQINRPAGRYTLRLEPKVLLLPNFFETAVTVAAGETAYFEIGAVTSATGAGWASAMMAGNVGQRMDGRSFNNTFQFNSLDAARGAAEVSKLKLMKQ
jgi:hypothetical protein